MRLTLGVFTSGSMRNGFWSCWFAALLGCTTTDPPAISCDVEAKPSTVAGIAKRFISDATFRKGCLESSLINKQNSYSKARLQHYGTNWASLPENLFKTRPITPSDIGRPPPLPDDTWDSIPTGNFDITHEGLRKRGEQMFLRFPAQIENSMLLAIKKEEKAREYGLWQTENSLGGLVWLALPGGVYPALTCSTCHASLDEHGKLDWGRPNHKFDLGRAKDAQINMRTLFSTWGNGRVDIAADGQDNPITIADVRAVRYQTYLHRTANVRNSLINLALRVETGLITAHRNAVQPGPLNAFALAYFLWSLGGQFDVNAPLRHPSRPVFERHCAKCHRGASHAGAPIPPETVSSPVADMPSEARGTGKLQVPSLFGVSSRKRLLFGGEASGTLGLLDPTRAHGGHYFGRELSDNDRQAIAEYLAQF